MKKIFAIFVALISFVALLFGCNNQPIPPENTLMKTKSLFASKMYFESKVGYFWEGTDEFGNYKEIFFVHSEAESHGYEDDALVVWPAVNTERILYNLNKYISDENIDLSPFSLFYPITMEDVVEKWENVNDLLNSFRISTFAYILDPGHAYGYEPAKNN